MAAFRYSRHFRCSSGATEIVVSKELIVIFLFALPNAFTAEGEWVWRTSERAASSGRFAIRISWSAVKLGLWAIRGYGSFRSVDSSSMAGLKRGRHRQARPMSHMNLLTELEEFAHDHRPHGPLTADATEPAWNGYLLTAACLRCGVWTVGHAWGRRAGSAADY